MPAEAAGGKIGSKNREAQGANESAHAFYFSWRIGTGRREGQHAPSELGGCAVGVDITRRWWQPVSVHSVPEAQCGDSDWQPWLDAGLQRY